MKTNKSQVKNLEEVVDAVNNAPIEGKEIANSQSQIKLSTEEIKVIEESRNIEIKKEVFIQAYNNLVKIHKFAITVDLESPLSKPSLNVVKVG